MFDLSLCILKLLVLFRYLFLNKRAAGVRNRRFLNLVPVVRSGRFYLLTSFFNFIVVLFDRSHVAFDLLILARVLRKVFLQVAQGLEPIFEPVVLADVFILS
jgi:hypothetical protein